MSDILRRLSLALPLLLLQAALAALAQQTAKAATALAEIALLDGPSRVQRLVDGAKKEGEVTIYMALGQDDFAPVLDAFTKKYGIKLKAWRSSSENVLGRIVGEERAGHFEIDVVESNVVEMEALHREKLLLAVKSPEHANLMPQAFRPHRDWVGHAIAVYAHAYNTILVKKEDVPKSYQDLLDPRWKGRLGIDGDDQNWFATLSQELGEEKTHKLFDNIVATNGVSVRKGHTLLANLVVAGEVPLALTVYSYRVARLKVKGSPIEWFTIPPATGHARPLYSDRLRQPALSVFGEQAQVVFRRVPDQREARRRSDRVRGPAAAHSATL